MSDIIIKIENLHKKYRLGQIGTGTIVHDFNRWWCKFLNREDPYLKLGEVNDPSTFSSDEYVYALNNINFEVFKGEVLGIIGKNGAGKSTLLKILSKITGPSSGYFKSKGKIASLLEVGTGFHPELTGRENIYMNGTIMGMSRKEISKKLEDIVDFSGVNRYLDTPVKRYSSGMTVRLGFAVAAHLDPDILVVDEVLAVGDAEFQKKAIGKMKGVSKEQGRTVLFVSHNMAAVKSLCNRVLLLKEGKVSFSGNVDEGVEKYLSDGANLSCIKLSERNDRIQSGNKDIKLVDYTITDLDNNVMNSVNYGYGLKINLLYESKSNLNNLLFYIVIHKNDGSILSTFSNCYTNKIINSLKGNGIVSILIPELKIHPGDYFLDFHIAGKEGNTIDGVENAAILQVESSDKYPYTPYYSTKQGVYIDHEVFDNGNACL
ncbi:MAG: ABC transporter ATP-binding protein [Planctomycetota bacterium]|jgi:lipopolysaccharide transport system ATP-binding protein